jgi:hypothetical protein
MTIASSNLKEAKILADEILQAFETSSSTISELLMKTMRLARLMNDTDAEKWLDLEIRGYPSKFHFSCLGTCARYNMGARLNTETDKYWTESLPKLEGKTQTCNVEAFISRGYPMPTINSVRQAYISQIEIFEAIKASIYRYVVDVHISLSVGEFAEDIFNSARETVDVFLRENCPEASKQLLSIQKRMKDDDPESYAQALTTCRRLLSNVADAIFPAQSKNFTDKSGNERKVGKKEYKNRLLAFIEEHSSSDSTLCILEKEMEHLAGRLDSIYDKSCKGVHDRITREEAELVIIHMYLFLAEIAKLNLKKAEWVDVDFKEYNAPK